MTPLEQAQARVAELERELAFHRDIYENSPDMKVTVDAETALVKHCNRTLAERLGYTKDEIIGSPVFDLYHPDSLGAAQEAFLNFVNTGVVRGARLMLGRKDGSGLHVLLDVNSVKDAAGRVIQSRSTWRDISDLVAAEEALKEYSARLEEEVQNRTAALREGEARLAKETAATAAIVNELLTEEAEDAETELQILDACLAATGSEYGMLGVINDDGRYDTTTYNGQSLEGCAFPAPMAWDLSTGMDIRGVWGWPMLHGEPLICNDPPSHPDSVGQPEGHVAIHAYLGVPVRQEGEVTGMVAVANRPGGFTRADRDTLTRLVAIMTVARQYRDALRTARMTGAELEAKVSERTADLEAVNRELESFAYSISHDLRAPLRSMDGFSLALLEDYPDCLDDTGQDYLRRIRGAAQRMGVLIDDLLRLSRLSTVEMQDVRVDLGAFARSVAEELFASEPERRVTVDVAPDLLVHGDPTLLRSVMQNLLANAWKFTGGQPHGHIEVGEVEQGGERVFFVRDDGAGFDMAYADKLFGVFQRLHDTAEFPGTGVGLATVQRAIRRHGGRVWGESAVDEGACFYFTLPGGRGEGGGD